MKTLQLFIIDSSFYRKTRSLRYILYVICFLLFGSLIRPSSRGSEETYSNLIELLGLNQKVIIILLISSSILAFILFAYSKNYIRKGLLEITPLLIRITLYSGKSSEFLINDVENFKISRGSTLHYANKESVPPETNDNWIYFKYDLINYQYEFMINFEEENRNFEEMISILRREYPKFYYESI